MEKGGNTLLDVDVLMFGGVERMVEPPLTAGVESENEIRLSCEKEMELYLKTPGIPLRDANGKFTDPLSWWKAVDKAGKFPVLCRLAERFLCIPATSAPSERIWSRGGGVLTAKRNRLGSAVASSTMFLKENKHAMKAYFEFIKKRAKELK